MKIGILKLGANITQSTSIKTASNFDIFSLTDLLIEKGHQIFIITKKTRNTVLREPYKLKEIMKVNKTKGLDALLVFNGAINFFGGKESPEFIQNYKIINQATCKIFYVMTDSRYPLKQLWPIMLLKDWHVKYKKEEIWVNRSDINYLYQGSDRQKVHDLICRNQKNVQVDFGNIYPFPIAWAIMMSPPKPVKTPYADRPYDLFYAGANRDRKRADKFEEYYKYRSGFTINNRILRVAIGGSIKVEFEPDKKFGTIEHKQFITTMGKAKATIIIGDKFYQDNFITLRVYESILAGCVVFIDYDFDSHKCIYEWMEDKETKGFLYIKNKIELQMKLKVLSTLPEHKINEIRKQQYNAIMKLNNRNNYTSQLVSILNRG